MRELKVGDRFIHALPSRAGECVVTDITPHLYYIDGCGIRRCMTQFEPGDSRRIASEAKFVVRILTDEPSTSTISESDNSIYPPW